MRHGKRINHLGRTHSHRSAMLANMASSLIKHKRITTTVAKAKALRKYVEPLMTKSKTDTTHSRRIVFSYLQDKDAVSELFRDVATKVGDRPGGYTRIIRTGNRPGDQAEMCMMELVDYNDLMLAEKETKKKPSRRRRRGGGAKTGAAAAATAAATDVAEAVEEAADDAADAVEETVEAVAEEVAEEASKEEAEEEEADEEEGGEEEEEK